MQNALTFKTLAYKMQVTCILCPSKGETMGKTYHTKTKELIIEYIKANKERRFRAGEIYYYLKGMGKEVNLTTIYRNLDRMEEENILMKYKTAENDSATYQYVEPHGNCHEHLHLQCKNCGKIIHLEGELMEQIKEFLHTDHGFVLDCPGSSLVGLCGDCKHKR